MEEFVIVDNDLVNMLVMIFGVVLVDIVGFC